LLSEDKCGVIMKGEASVLEGKTSSNRNVQAK